MLGFGGFYAFGCGVLCEEKVFVLVRCSGSSTGSPPK